MQHSVVKRLLLATALGSAAAVLAQNPSADGSGETGLTNPRDVIAGRQALMIEMERLIKPIDAYAAGESADPSELTEAAASIAAMLRAFPHLFSPQTNLYEPAAETPETLALPAIWENFPAFYELSSAAFDTAAAMASTADEADLRSAAVSVRASCDGCHALYMKPYTPAEVSSEDLEFDFDSVLPQE